jgi:hypothetical protein
MRPIQRSQTIFIDIPANAQLGSTVYLPDIPELRDAVIDGIETYTDTELAFSLTGNPVVTVAGIREATLNLVQESDRRAQDFPLQSLLAVAYGGIYKEFSGWRLNWQKCYLQLVGTASASTTVVLNVFYHYEPKKK